MSIIVGIDPGKSGGLAKIDTDNVGYLRTCKCPDNTIDMAGLITSAQNSAYIDNSKLIVYIENVHAFPTDARSSAFKFGTNFGMWLGILGAYKIEPIRVQPQVWMRDIQPLPKVKKERKLEIKRLAIEMFPDNKITLSTADAVMLAVWGARHE